MKITDNHHLDNNRICFRNWQMETHDTGQSGSNRTSSADLSVMNFRLKALWRDEIVFQWTNIRYTRNLEITFG